jgi:hypothetical protein
MMHGIAQSAVFCNGLLGLCVWAVICRFIACCIYRMGMRIHHILPCDKAEHQHPGKDYMGFVFFQVSTPFKGFAQNYKKKSLNKYQLQLSCN